MEAICAALERTAQARRKRVCCERANKSCVGRNKKSIQAEMLECFCIVARPRIELGTS